MLTIENQALRLTVDPLGAQMTSLQSRDGTEYLWQGDPRYWADQAPTLFPFIGRLTQGRCQYEGKEYPMDIHGFANVSLFTPVVQQEDRLVLEFTDSPETLRRYPVSFRLQVGFSLDQNRLTVSYRAENRDRKLMAFGLGGHPGFRVPLEEGEAFEDYALSFAHPCAPERIGFTDSVFLSGEDRPYPLEDGQTLPLSHSLFDEDAIILRNCDRGICLRSRKSNRSVTLSYSDFPYLGLWHMPHTQAPYLCIEPWTSLPSRQDVVEELTQKSDMIRLQPGKVFEACWTVTLT